MTIIRVIITAEIVFNSKIHKSAYKVHSKLKHTDQDNNNNHYLTLKNAQSNRNLQLLVTMRIKNHYTMTFTKNVLHKMILNIKDIQSFYILKWRLISKVGSLNSCKKSAGELIMRTLEHRTLIIFSKAA